jgi:hypothetical protein
MEPSGEMRLPDIGDEAFVLNPAIERIYKILWAVDPALLRRVDLRVLVQLNQVNLRYRAEVARLEAQKLQVEAKAYEEMASALGKIG